MSATVTQLPTAVKRRPPIPGLRTRRRLAADLPRIPYKGSDYWPNGQKKAQWPPDPTTMRPPSEIILLSLVAALGADEDGRSARLRGLILSSLLSLPESELLQKASDLIKKAEVQEGANG